MIVRRRWLLLAALTGAAPWARAMSAGEQARVDRLILYVASRKDVEFVRNGSAYSAQDAAEFLRGKLDSMGGHVYTARQFIDDIASKSSTSGEPYLIRFADGRTETAAKFLGDELRRIDAAK